MKFQNIEQKDIIEGFAIPFKEACYIRIQILYYGLFSQLLVGRSLLSTTSLFETW